MSRKHLQPEKMSLTSMDITEEKRCQLKQIFPEVFCEDKVDFDQLKRVLGEWVEPDKERFGLNWPGKAECMKIIQQPSLGTLKPCRAESVNFDKTENVFIEGENLEILKLLQKAYFGKVKMTYIDPPYNTGNDFIYPDDYKDPLNQYMRYTGQADDNGRKFSTNSDKTGRFHSNWLNMMYPRLYIARQLLREDGVIFISIDNHEVTNLRAMCNQIFGEENFVEVFIWKRKTPPNNVIIGKIHEYIIAYAKNIEELKTFLLPREAKKDTDYKNPDNDIRGRWKPDNLTAAAKGGRLTSSLIYKIINPDTGEEHFPPNGRMWIVPREEMLKKIKEKTIYWGKDGKGRPMDKRFLNQTRDGMVQPSILEEVGSNTSASKGLSGVFDGKVLFDTPKPLQLLTRFMKLSSKNNDIILDFFSGSCTTAHAVMELNVEDGGNRKYICVQLPEPCDEKSEAFKAGYKTIADIAKERIRRAAQKIAEENPDKAQNVDLGFKVFKLNESNFKIWNSNVENSEDLQRQLELNIEHIKPDSSIEDILYEVLLKDGLPLTTKIEKKQLVGKDVYAIENGTMLICLDKQITPQLIDAMATANPSRVICLDAGFRGNDQLKVNAVQTFKTLAEQQEREIVFRTV